MASMGFMSWRTLRRIQVLRNSSGSINISSRLVPERLTSIAGHTRLSTSRRSKCNSMFPVPLNSSKMWSSARLPVSTNAVARIVRLPPSSILRAAPKNLFGFCNAVTSIPPVMIFPELGASVLWARANRVMESRKMTTSCPYSTCRLAFSITISATWI